ncbi:hypothetical protein ACSAZK_02230 [Methanosarcina sp. Mfa9]|uniref:hypothetical protein n=1 Tax=Methanosarcina sp. Mfa9 TaxID=3439063 RepID=UPI003F84E1DE
MFIAGRAFLSGEDCVFAAGIESRKVAIRTALKRSLKHSAGLLKRVVFVAFPVSIIVFVLIDMGTFDALSQYSGWMPLPP